MGLETGSIYKQDFPDLDFQARGQTEQYCGNVTEICDKYNRTLPSVITIGLLEEY